MTTIEIRFRDYKDPRKRGTYLLINGHQKERISPRQLTNREIAEYRKRLLLAQKGYVQKDYNTYRKQPDEDHIKEVKLGDLQDEVSDIERDPNTKKWTKEKPDDRDYTDPEDVEELRKVA